MQHTTRPTAYRPQPAVLAGAGTQPPATSDMQRLLARFAPISLSAMDAVALQNRTDTKYLLTTTQLTGALRALVGQYRVLEVNGVRLNPYQTLYFDTPDFALYLQHHAGKSNRYKVRSRRYMVTDQSFLEIKRKTNKDRTVKRRIPTEEIATTCTPEVAGFIAACAPGLAQTLEPKLWNAFSRITLVSTMHAERLTIDLDLSFRGDGRRVALPGIAVAEVKQDGVDRSSGFIQTSVELSIGVGFGLFAIFSVLRYRTEETPIREMTYLFVLLALPVMNAVLMPTGALAQLLLANGAVVALLFVLERGWGFRFESSSRVTYERIDLIQPGRYAELLADLRARTGLPVTRAKVGRIDFLRDSAELTLYYTQAESEEAGRGLRPLQNPHLGSDGGMV